MAISAIDTEITGFTPGGPLDDAGEIRDYEQGLPNIRYILTARHAYGPFDLLLRYSYHGGWYDSEETLDFDGYGLLDAGARYTLGNGVALTLGSDNLLDTYPDRNPNARSGLGNLYSQYAPAGFNGRFLYAKLAVFILKPPCKRVAGGSNPSSVRFFFSLPVNGTRCRHKKMVARVFAEGLDGFKGGVDTRKYCRLTKCSRATAFRDLDDMLKRGILVKRPGLGRNVSYDLVTLDRSMYPVLRVDI